MKKQKKQSLLNAIITILIIALVMMVASIIYEEKINMTKQPTQDTSSLVENEKKEDIINDEETLIEDKDKAEVEEKEETEEPKEEYTEKKEEYIGEEENSAEQQPEKSTDEKVIDLVKKEWGEDNTATFNIEKKNGTKYRVAVRDNSTTVLQWYEVDIETWEVSEY